MKMSNLVIDKLILTIVFLIIILGISLTVYAGETDIDELNGAELWSHNCSRCHNMRSPAEYDDSQWGIIVSHMRVIANIPGEQARAILKFLQNSNNPPPQPIESPETSIKIDTKQKQAATQGDKKNGEKLFSASCSACHGISGVGDGPAAASMQPKPPNFRDQEYMANLTDEYLFKIIKEGGASVDKSPFMPAWGSTLSNREIRDIILYIRTL